MIGLLLLSLSFTTIIAFLISFGFYFIHPELSFAIFWITFGLEWIIMEPVNRILKIKSMKQEAKTFEKMAKYEDVTGKQLISLECEYCGELNPIKIDLNRPNSFVCTKCENGNNVIIQFSTTRITNPIDTIKPSGEDEIILDELKELEIDNE